MSPEDFERLINPVTPGPVTNNDGVGDGSEFITPAPTPVQYSEDPVDIALHKPPEMDEGNAKVPHLAQWDPILAERMGHSELADQIRDYKREIAATPLSPADGPVPAKDLFIMRGQQQYGRTGNYSAQSVIREVAMANLYKMMWKAKIDPHGPGFAQLPQETQARMIATANDLAQRQVYGMIGIDEDIENAVVDLDPEKTVQELTYQDHWLYTAFLNTLFPYMMGRPESFDETVLSLFPEDVQEKARNIRAQRDEDLQWENLRPQWLSSLDTFVDVAQAAPRRIAAPIVAMAQPGGQTIQATAGHPVQGIEKQGKLWWLLSTGLWKAAGSAAFPRDYEATKEDQLTLGPARRLVTNWGTEDHVRRIYSEGYDIIDEMDTVGDLYSLTFPWAPEWTKPIAGFAGIAAAILVEPDLTSLTLFTAKPLKLGRLFKPALNMVHSVYKPAIKEWEALLRTYGKSVEDVVAKHGGRAPEPVAEYAAKVERAKLLKEIAGATGDHAEAAKLFDEADRILVEADRIFLDDLASGYVDATKRVNQGMADRIAQELKDLGNPFVTIERGLKKWTPRWWLWQSAKTGLLTKMLAEHGISNTTRATMLSRTQDIITSLVKRADTEATIVSNNQASMASRVRRIQKKADQFLEAESVADEAVVDSYVAAHIMGIVQAEAAAMAQVESLERLMRAGNIVRNPTSPEAGRLVTQINDAIARLITPGYADELYEVTNESIQEFMKYAKAHEISELQRLIEAGRRASGSAWLRAPALALEAAKRDVEAFAQSRRALRNAVEMVVRRGEYGPGFTQNMWVSLQNLLESSPGRPASKAALGQLKTFLGRTRKAVRETHEEAARIESDIGEAEKLLENVEEKTAEALLRLEKLEKSVEAWRPSNLARIMGETLSETSRGLQAVSDDLLKGTESTILGMKDAAVREATERLASGDLTPANFVDQVSNMLTYKYGQMTASAALAAFPRFAAQAGSLSVDELTNMALGIERATVAHNKAAMTVLKGQDIVPRALESVRNVPRVDLDKSLTFENGLALAMRAGASLADSLDGLTTRGLAHAPSVVRELFRGSFEWMRGAEAALDKVSDAAYRNGDHVLEKVWEFIATRNPVYHNGILLTANQDHLTIVEKAYRYLQMLSKNPDAFKEDLMVKAIAHAPQASGVGSEVGGAAARAELLRIVQDSKPIDGIDFFDNVDKRVTSKILAHHKEVDRTEHVLQQVYRAALHGAMMYDTIYDMARSGLTSRIGAKAANGLKFITNKQSAVGLREHQIAADAVREIMEKFNLPLTEEVLTKRLMNLKEFFGPAVEASNKLVQVAQEGDLLLEVPRYVWEAWQNINVKLAKELKQFNVPKNIMADRAVRSFFGWISHSMVYGYALTNFPHFGRTVVGDWAQKFTMLGARASFQHTAKQALGYFIPFFGSGRRIQEGMAAVGRRHSIAEWMFSRKLDDVMRGASDTALETADGAITPLQMLKDANRAGADEIMGGTQFREIVERQARGDGGAVRGVFKQMHQVFERMGLKGSLGYVTPEGLTLPSRMVRDSVEYMEALQHRARVQIYMEARTGQLPGEHAGRMFSHEEAGKLMRETMFDWSLGIPRWEAETIGRFSLFWTYKRLMMRQLGSSIAATMSEGKPLWRIITGNTALGRTRKMGRLMSMIPEAVYWTDDEAMLDDELQVREMGRRHFPWWVKAEPLLFNREISDEQQLYWSDVAKKNVTYESLLLPGLTTLDALYEWNLLTNMAIMSSIHVGQAGGYFEDSATAPWNEIGGELIDATTDSFGTGLDEAFNDALRGVIGNPRHASMKGETVPASTAALLNRLGWGDFVESYVDEDGVMRYRADSGALAIAGRIVALSPPAQDLIRYYKIADSPAMYEGVGPWVSEGYLQLSGLVKYAQHNPVDSLNWDAKIEQYQLKDMANEAKAARKRRETLPGSSKE